eukprot:scaffold67420_cov35-Attheya_sp.AAC.1
MKTSRSGGENLKQRKRVHYSRPISNRRTKNDVKPPQQLVTAVKASATVNSIYGMPTNEEQAAQQDLQERAAELLETI